MQIIDKTFSLSELKQLAGTTFGDLVKAVVDVDREIIAIDAELHSDLEALLLENGSKQASLWGINLYLQMHSDDFIEFDSMINLRPSHGNKSRSVENEEIREKIRNIVSRKISA